MINCKRRLWLSKETTTYVKYAVKNSVKSNSTKNSHVYEDEGDIDISIYTEYKVNLYFNQKH